MKNWLKDRVLMTALAVSLGSHLLAGLLVGNLGAQAAPSGVAMPIALVVNQETAQNTPTPEAKPKVTEPRSKPKPKRVRAKRKRPATPRPAEIASLEPAPTADVPQPDEAEPAPAPTIEQDVPASEVNLGLAAPAGTRLSLVLRADRLRGTDFAESVIKILEPMPDYRTLVSGTEMSLVDNFDVLIIATSDPRDVTATFLAARAAKPLETIRPLLAGTPEQSRVRWSPIAAGWLGKRTNAGRIWPGDPRVLLSVREHWILLARPEHVSLLTAPAATAPAPDAGPAEFSTPAASSVPAAPPVAEPAWLNHLEAVARQTGATDEQGPALVIGFAGAGEVLSVPAVGPVRVPDVLTLAVTAQDGALVVKGSAVFQNEAQAAAFALAAHIGKAQAASSMTTRFLLRQMNLTSAVASLSVQRDGQRVVITAMLSADDTQRVLTLAAGWSRDWFEARMRPPRSSDD